MEALILRWGYLAVGLGTFFEGETILVAGGAMAHRGLLSLWWVIASAFVGSLAGDQLWFLLGLHYGPPFLATRPRIQQRTAVVEGWLHRYGTVFVLGFRFLYGLRSVTPVLLGVSRYPPARFVALNAVGAALWAVGFGYLGYGVGASLAALLDRHGRVEELLLAGLAVGTVVALVCLRARRARQRAAAASTQAAQRGGH